MKVKPRLGGGKRLDPYGLDASERLLALAPRRLPHWHDRFFVGDALTWIPPRRFDFVHTMVDRMAIGQLAEYARFAPGAKRAVLLVERPRPDLEMLLKREGRAAVWQTIAGFEDNLGGSLTSAW